MQRLRSWLILLVLAQALMSFRAAGALRLPVFKAGTKTYTNVVITASSQGRVLVDYGRGMAAVHVTDLDLDTQQQLVEAGLVNPLLAKEIEKEITKRDATKRKAEQARTGASPTLTIENAETTSLAQLFAAQSQHLAADNHVELDPQWFLGRFGRKLLAGISAALVIAGILRRFLFYRLCKNATGAGSLLVFLPVFRWIPLADAARINRRWLLVPLFGIVALFFPPPLVDKFPWAALAYLGMLALLWLVTFLLYTAGCVRVCGTLGRSAGWAIFLFFPLLDYIPLFVFASGTGDADTSPMGLAGGREKPVLAI